MNDIEQWDSEKNHLRKYFAQLDFLQLLALGRDIATMLDYRSKQIGSMLDHQEFDKMMRSEWGTKELSG